MRVRVIIAFFCVLLTFLPVAGQGDDNKRSKPINPKKQPNRIPLKRKKFHSRDPKIELVEIPLGSFTMGSTGSSLNEQPLHKVTISQPFFMGKFEITQAQWSAVMGYNPSFFNKCDLCPVESVSWNQIQDFLNKLNSMDRVYKYDLPSEEQWEYCCRAGTTGDFAGCLDEMAWFGNNSGLKWIDSSKAWEESGFDGDKYSNGYLKPNKCKSHPVGGKRPNNFGLFDMHGNVWEWCRDLYRDNYTSPPKKDDDSRSLRGGSWSYSPDGCRSSYRYGSSPSYASQDGGFRVIAMRR